MTKFLFTLLLRILSILSAICILFGLSNVCVKNIPKLTVFNYDYLNNMMKSYCTDLT
jgi:hypothetical protein